MFCCKNSANETSTYNLNRIYRVYFYLVEAFLDKRVNIKLQVHPHALHNHSAWDTCVKRHSMYVIFAISVIS